MGAAARGGTDLLNLSLFKSIIFTERSGGVAALCHYSRDPLRASVRTCCHVWTTVWLQLSHRHLKYARIRIVLNLPLITGFTNYHLFQFDCWRMPA